MIIFKSVDKKLEDIGFYKLYENKYGACYERYNEEYGYCQIISFVIKSNGDEIIQSYETDVNSDGFNNMVGIKTKETRLILKKIKHFKLKLILNNFKRRENNE